MTIDWFTFTAQILNFLVLVWLMKRFLYGPIVTAMDQREARIADRLHEAAGAREAAEQRGQRYQQQLDELASTREEQLAVASREVETWRDEHLCQAKEEVEHARAEWHRGLLREKQSLLQRLQLDGAQHAMEISQHLLKQLADEQLQNRLIRLFLTQLAEADEPTLNALEAVPSGQPVQIESSHPIQGVERDHLAAAVREVVGADVHVEFRVNSDLLCGIELRIPGCKVAWSFRESLAELEGQLIDMIEQALPTSFPDLAADATPDAAAGSDRSAVEARG